MARVAVSTPTDIDDAPAGLASVAHGMRSLQRLRGSRQVHAALMEAADVDLSQQAVQVLTAVRDGASVAEVADAARMDMGAVSRQLKVLEDDGLLARTVSPDNGSVVLVSLTRRGRSVADRVTSVRDGHLAAALSHWSADDIDTLGHLLRRLVDDLQTTPYTSRPRRNLR